jgi:hypothetical protein
VNGIIEVATDPGRTNARRFSFEVHLDRKLERMLTMLLA